MEILPKKLKVMLLVLGLMIVVIFAAALVLSTRGGRELLKQSSGPGRKTVTVSNYKFFPEALKVSYGDTVAWINTSDKQHTVTFRTLSKTLVPGETWEWTITPDHFLKGNNMYWCDFHAKQGMQGSRVIVE